MPLFDFYDRRLPNKPPCGESAFPLNLASQHTLCNDINALLIHFYQCNNRKRLVNFYVHRIFHLTFLDVPGRG
jgi:hypothetical protein